MNNYDVKRFALILSVQAEVEAMKALNTYRSHRQETIAYNQDSFRIAAEQFRLLASKHDDEL